jgi:hypothetical protein
VLALAILPGWGLSPSGMEPPVEISLISLGSVTACS